MLKDTFNFVMPAELVKSDDGSWKVAGLASTSNRDLQGEVLLPDGMDLSPVDSGKGLINWDHKMTGPEDIIGSLDSYSKTSSGLYITGRLFKNHAKAQAVHGILSSLSKADKGKMGISVEGRIVERDSRDPRIVKKCKISAIALTMSPVNSDTYADLVKSFGNSELDFDSTKESMEAITSTVTNPEEPTFTTKQVMSLIAKALAVGDASAIKPPAERSGGDALAQESLESEVVDAKEPKKKLKKMEKALYKSVLETMLNKIQVLYPENTRAELWTALKDRLNTKFPNYSPEDK